MSRPLGSLRSKAARLQLSFLFNFLSSTRLSRTLQKNTDEGRGQLSPTRRGSIQWRGRWRRRSEDHGVERQKATLKIRQITRKSHTKLHMYRGKLLCQSGIPVQTIESQEPPRLPPPLAAAPIDPARSKLCAGPGKERSQEAGAARRPLNPSQKHPERRKRKEKPLGAQEPGTTLRERRRRIRGPD